MPTKRAVLAELTRAELRANLDSYELAVDDRRVKAQLVDALARFRKARLEEMLLRLPRDRLKELCRVFGLDDAGRKKANLVSRLVGPGSASPASESPNVVSRDDGGIAPPAASCPAAEAPEPPADVLSVAQLEQYLWSAADILRGSIDSSDYKTCIFGLRFLKRLSDRFEEEAEKLIAEGVLEDVAWTDPDEHQFFVPDRARWDAIQKRATNIGETLNKACAALEEQNNALEGVLAGIDYNDERKLGDARNRDTVLARLVQHFSQVSLRNDRMAEPDLLGRAYEYLIEQFADDAGKKGGEFYGTGIPASILVLNRDKSAARKGKVLFIDSSGEFEEGSNQNRLRDRDIANISRTFHACADVDKYARVVPLDEIEQNDWNLNISRYVDTSEEEEGIDVADTVRKLRQLEQERAAAEATMNRYVAELEYG